MLREPIDLPPIVSVELIQITDKTSIPYAPKARKIIEETKKKEEERLVSEQAPPAAKAKEKPDRIPLPNEKKEEKKIIKKKQNPEEVKPEIRQASEFEKKEIVDTNQIAALIDKAKELEAVEQKKTDKVTKKKRLKKDKEDKIISKAKKVNKPRGSDIKEIKNKRTGWWQK